MKKRVYKSEDQVCAREKLGNYYDEQTARAWLTAYSGVKDPLIVLAMMMNMEM